MLKPGIAQGKESCQPQMYVSRARLGVCTALLIMAFALPEDGGLSTHSLVWKSFTSGAFSRLSTSTVRLATAVSLRRVPSSTSCPKQPRLFDRSSSLPLG
jgi:hypothetical protein